MVKTCIRRAQAKGAHVLFSLPTGMRPSRMRCNLWEGGGGGDSPGLLTLLGYPYGTEDGKLLKRVRNRFFPATPRTMQRFHRRGRYYAALIVRTLDSLSYPDGQELAAAVVLRALAVARDLTRSAGTNKSTQIDPTLS